MKIRSLFHSAAVVAMIAAVFVSAFSLGSCKSDDTYYNEITFDVSDKVDTAVCVLPPTSFLGIDTRFNFNMPDRNAAVIRIEFDCNSQVHWNLTDIPSGFSVEPSATGAGKGYFVLSVPEATGNTTSQMFMTLRQLDSENNKELARLTHRIIVKQP